MAVFARIKNEQVVYAEPTQKRQGTHHDPSPVTIIHRDDARTGGLQLVEEMSLQFHYPAEFPMILFNREETEA
jgi:hypothetical protein